MAAVRNALNLLKLNNTNNLSRSFSTNIINNKKLHFIKVACGCAVGVGALFYVSSKIHNKSTVYAFKNKKKEDDFLLPSNAAGVGSSKTVKLTSRERRFIKFASVEFNGQVYMTPQDFLESFVDQEPRPRLKRRALTPKDVDSIKDSTPPLSRGSTVMFRSLRDKGIISFTEYLFLLSILTKPQTGFRIAFNMFDTDGNERVDKNEFLVMEKIFSHAWKDKHGIDGDQQKQIDPENTSSGSSITEEFIDDEQGLQRKHIVDTTLIVHFFGPRGSSELKYEGFRRFMENLQTEVLEMEFNEFSKGAPTISEMDFARILLRYTYLSTDIYDMYVNRLLDRVDADNGISFPEFRVFGQFLNNLEDFMIAMRMYTLADHPISKAEFTHIMKNCIRVHLPEHIVDCLFTLFGDEVGRMNYRDFTGIVNNYHRRTVKMPHKHEGWSAFTTCVMFEHNETVRSLKE